MMLLMMVVMILMMTMVINISRVARNAPHPVGHVNLAGEHQRAAQQCHIFQQQDRNCDDIYIMMKCLCVTKNDHFIKRPVCQP